MVEGSRFFLFIKLRCLSSRKPQWDNQSWDEVWRWIFARNDFHRVFFRSFAVNALNRVELFLTKRDFATEVRTSYLLIAFNLLFRCRNWHVILWYFLNSDSINVGKQMRWISLWVFVENAAKCGELFFLRILHISYIICQKIEAVNFGELRWNVVKYFFTFFTAITTILTKFRPKTGIGTNKWLFLSKPEHDMAHREQSNVSNWLLTKNNLEAAIEGIFLRY